MIVSEENRERQRPLHGILACRRNTWRRFIMITIHKLFSGLEVANWIESTINWVYFCLEFFAGCFPTDKVGPFWHPNRLRGPKVKERKPGVADDAATAAPFRDQRNLLANYATPREWLLVFPTVLRWFSFYSAIFRIRPLKLSSTEFPKNRRTERTALIRLITPLIERNIFLIKVTWIAFNHPAANGIIKNCNCRSREREGNTILISITIRWRQEKWIKPDTMRRLCFFVRPLKRGKILNNKKNVWKARRQSRFGPLERERFPFLRD